MKESEYCIHVKTRECIAIIAYSLTETLWGHYYTTYIGVAYRLIEVSPLSL